MAIERVTAATYEEVVDFLTSAPSLQEIADYHLSAESDARVEYLLDANRSGTLTTEERVELEGYTWLEHFMRRIKIRALEKLTQP